MYLSKDEIYKRFLKYLLECLTVALACFILLPKSTDKMDILGIALVAGITFALLDMYVANDD
jgi:hypothetical protein